MLRKVHGVLLLMLTACVMVKPGSADDLLPPPWRWEPRTTFQHWTFDDDDNPAFPEFIQNPNGDAWADISVAEPHGAGWQDSLLGREGLWVDLVDVVLEIDNIQDPNGTKLLWIQVTFYDSPLHDFPVINVPSGTYIDGTVIQLECDALGCWWLIQEVWEIDPNPSHEVVDIAPENVGGWIVVDQIVVDTACFAGEPRIIDMRHITSGNVEITWTSEPEATYRVESSTDEIAYDGTMSWEIEQDNIPAGSGTTTSWEDADIPAFGFKFYRVCVENGGGSLATSVKADGGTGSVILKRSNLARGSHAPNNNDNGTRGRLRRDGNCGR